MRELSLNVMDIVQNSVTAKATFIEIIVKEITNDSLLSINDSLLSIIIKDNGCGMSEKQLKNVTDPFFTTRTTRSVGLGIPLFKMEAEQTGGSFSIDSEIGLGTTLKANFVTSHLDMTPLGNINSTVSILIRCNPDIDFLYRRSIDDKSFDLDTKELRQVLGNDVPLNSSEVMQWIDEYLKEQTQNLIGGKDNNEIIG
ncbi:MAG: ATP-binding protein [Bacillota bacterium]|nr:ATP-binding protein [Bacillota bacterium]